MNGMHEGAKTASGGLGKVLGIFAINSSQHHNLASLISY